jgi:hypothetical protein
MSQRALALPEIASFPPPVLSGTAADSALQLPARAKRFEFDRLPESAAEDGSCLKGAGFALGFEVLAALCIYGVWQLWQLLR